MPKQRDIEEVYSSCTSEGKFLPQAKIDVHKIKSMLKIVEEDLLTINDLKDSTRYNTLCKLNYDVLHTLTEALLLFDKIKSTNHQCLFTYLCTKHTELELNWNFFEQIRTKRNGINYYGTMVDKEDWKNLSLQITLYTNILKTTISNKLKHIK